MDDLLKQIGNRILHRRKQLRMTQEELSEKAGITPPDRFFRRTWQKSTAPGKYHPGLFRTGYQHRLPASRRSECQRPLDPDFQNLKSASRTIPSSRRYYQQLYLRFRGTGNTEKKIILPMLISYSEMLTWYLQSVLVLPDPSLLADSLHPASSPA